MKKVLPLFTLVVALVLSSNVWSQVDCSQLPALTLEFENPKCETQNAVFHSSLAEFAEPDWVFTWDFGDGNTATGAHVDHSYSQTNYYNVRHMVSIPGCGTKFAESNELAYVASPFSIVVGKKDKVCNASEALAYVATYGGRAPFTYEWAHGDENRISRNLTNGTYSVVVTSHEGCVQEGEVSLDVEVYPPIELEFSATHTYCEGEEQEISVEVKGGIEPLYGFWHHGEETQTITPNGSGEYFYEVYDAVGCFAMDYVSYHPQELPLPSVSFDKKEVVCPGESPELTALPVGGSAPYSFEWSNGATEATLTNVASGSYGVQLTDANGCAANGTVDVAAQIAEQVAVDFNKVETVCDAADTKLEATLNGGTAPLTFQWSNGETVNELTGIASGEYTLSVTDGLGCVSEHSTTLDVTIPSPIEIGLEGPSKICSDEVATLAANVSGGLSPLTLHWNTGETSSEIEATTSGEYVLTVLDALGCSSEAVKAVQVVSTPSAPSVESVYLCEEGDATLVAEGSADKFHWSTSADFSGALEGATFYLPYANSSQTFFARGENDGCFSDVVEAQVIVQNRTLTSFNGGFESGFQNVKYARVEKADGWYSAAGTPDLFDERRFGGLGISSAINDRKDNISPIGNRYAALQAVNSLKLDIKSSPLRGTAEVGVTAQLQHQKVEAIGSKLNEPMEVGSVYSVNMNVAKGVKHLITQLKVSPIADAEKAHFVVKLSTSPANSSGYRATNAKVVFEGSTSNTENWDNVAFDVVADNAYKYIIIESVPAKYSKNNLLSKLVGLGTLSGLGGAKVNNLVMETYMFVDEVSVLKDCPGAANGGLANKQEEIENDVEHTYFLTTFSDQQSEVNESSTENLGSFEIAASNQDVLAASLEVYPNPNNGSFKVGFELASDAPTQVLVTNSVGQVVSVQTIDAMAYNNEISFDNTTLSPGVYSLVIKSDEFSSTKRFVVR